MTPADYVIERYDEAHAEVWDGVVRESRNGTFILERRYMDYHADRFKDMSLIVRNKTGRILGLMAAAVPIGGDDDVVTAHPGLTYGGLILPYRTNSLEAVGMIEAVAGYYRQAGYKYLKYKPIPHVYHRFPSEEDVYQLIRMGAVVDECLISSTIRLDVRRPSQNDNTRRNIAKATKNGVEYRLCVSDGELKAYYDVLSNALTSRHDTHPVHSFEELKLLMSRFPENIKLWAAISDNGEILAGVVLYLTQTCVHAQYIAASESGFRTSALAELIEHIINVYAPSYQYFDFGNSNENHGLILNEGLIRQKSGFGARGTTAMTLLLRL